MVRSLVRRRTAAFGVAARFGAAAGRATRRWLRGSSSRGVVKRKSFTKSASHHKRRRVTKKKSGSSMAVYDGAGGSHSMFRRNVRGASRLNLKQFQRFTNKNVYSYTSTQRMTSAVIVQGTYLTSRLFYGTDLTAVLETLMASSAAGYKTSKCFIHSGFVESKFTNQEKANVEMILYDIIPKRDISAAQIAGNFDVLSSWNTGLTDMNTTGSGTSADKSNLGSTPFDSVLFCQYYTVLKKTKVMLSQGSTHIHRVRSVWNGMINHEYSANDAYLRGKTILTLAVINGMPLNDQSTKTNVAVGAAAVDVVNVVRIVYQGFYNNGSTYSFTDGQQAVATPYVMDEGSGEPETDVAA